MKKTQKEINIGKEILKARKWKERKRMMENDKEIETEVENREKINISKKVLKENKKGE